jgi:hypothetical protein
MVNMVKLSVEIWPHCLHINISYNYFQYNGNTGHDYKFSDIIRKEIA